MSVLFKSFIDSTVYYFFFLPSFITHAPQDNKYAKR